jgi:hypothetical protein
MRKTAYDRYSQQASLRFDLEGKSETIRQLRARMSLCEEIGEYSMSEHIRNVLEREKSRQIDLAMALGEGAPDMTGSLNRARAYGVDRSS